MIELEPILGMVYFLFYMVRLIFSSKFLNYIKTLMVLI